ncbi:VPLPA-CTERM protein sorting domain-containing protein [Lutimaribacter pacificus]|uniref:VPLPA-CTERM protein sorting domain-containing protein n=1 Tax=Lutimaribacter pacificus TaxID=391948 RepID=A0A1H0AZQ5_9RHOB|nr:VPLPA-CTERM sorting domain-containing protein [Lutimaribacter pacificus]SDN38746.1 VPLPA-CTERM protein sorting domain-containing protein [Lutimaribacter pacificus]SHJ62547.1 VPLPA-CTERM protein sorting domain-containing protein [Lutimaribacter pacificus]
MRLYQTWAAVAALTLAGGVASADSIDPDTFTADLAVGESVTITKTVVISQGSPTTAPLDVMFLFDTTGSMGSQINNAKSAAGDIISGLGGIGDTRTGVAYYDDVAGAFSTPGTGACAPSECGIISDLSGTAANTISGINTLSASGGGDLPEEGNLGVLEVVNNASWRPDSNKFIVMLGDSAFKTPPADATVMAALAAEGVSLIGINYGGSAFENDVLSLGGTVFSGSGGGADILDDIIGSISAAFAEYDEVTLTDLGAAAPEISVSITCTGADSGACNGAVAEGDYDRSVERTFTFDVTFTRDAEGDKDFSLFATTDGRIVAEELDSFPGDGAVIPLPAAGWMLVSGLAGLGFVGRRRRKS